MVSPVQVLDNHQKRRLALYRQSFKIKAGDADGHNCLGLILMRQGMLNDAVMAFSWAISRQPEFARAYHNLGKAYSTLDETGKALAAYRIALRLEPDDPTAEHMVKALSGAEQQKPPRRFVRHLFDQYADTFEGHLAGGLKYQAPEYMRQALVECRRDRELYENAVDLGCGTGLIGVVFARLIRKFSGIDLSAKMLEKAKEKNVYDELEEGDICEALAARRESFDLFLAGDVFNYLGELSELFAIISDKARPAAPVIFTTETYDGRKYKLQKNGRYAHNPYYIRKQAGKVALKPIYNRNIRLRREKGTWLAGDVFVLVKEPLTSSTDC